MSSGSRITRGSLAAAEDIASLSARERLIFAQAVYENGAKQSVWADIAKILSKHPLITRPKNFFTSQSCVTIYNYLMNQAKLEQADTNEARRAPAHLRLAQRHYVDLLRDLKSEIAAEEERFKTLVTEIDEIRLGKWDDRIRAKLGGVDVALGIASNSPGSPREAEPKSMEKSQTSLEFRPPVVATPEYESADIREDGSKGEEPMDISSPHRDPPDDLPTQAEGPELAEGNVEAEVAEEEEEPIQEQPERKTRHSTRRRRSTGASQPLLPVSPDTALDVKSPGSPVLREKPCSRSSRSSQKPPSIDSAAANVSAVQEEGQEDVQEELNERTATEIDEEASEHQTPREGEAEEQLRLATSHEPSPAPQSRKDTKRRASDAEFVSESTREKKKAREESEPYDYADSPATPSASTSGPRNPKERKRFQNVIFMLHSQISQHRNGTIFHHPIKHSEAPDYQDIVKRPMDLKTIKNRVRDGAISTSSEYQRDIYLMFANSLMYNRPSSDIYGMAEEMMHESEAHINTFRQTEGFNARTRI